MGGVKKGCISLLHTENVARGGKLSFQNVGEAKVHTMY